MTIYYNQGLLSIAFISVGLLLMRERLPHFWRRRRLKDFGECEILRVPRKVCDRGRNGRRSRRTWEEQENGRRSIG
jgi:hypothetical protein